MLDGVVDLEQESRKVVVKVTKSPGCLSCRRIALCDLPDIPGDLRITAQVVNELSIRGAVM